MPNLDEHCRRTLKRYGVEGRDIHAWLDEPSREFAASHRQFRHDTETVRLAGEVFGKSHGRVLAENIALDHIMADHEEEIRKRNSVVNTEVSMETGNSGQIDREIEMEKLLLRKKKSELRKELELELRYTGETPIERIHELNSLKRFRGMLPREVAVLERLVQEDLQNNPSLEKEVAADIERRNQAIEARRKAVEQRIVAKIIAFLLLVLSPALGLGYTINSFLGLLWFVFGSIVILVV